MTMASTNRTHWKRLRPVASSEASTNRTHWRRGLRPVASSEASANRTRWRRLQPVAMTSGSVAASANRTGRRGLRPVAASSDQWHYSEWNWNGTHWYRLRLAASSGPAARPAAS